MLLGKNYGMLVLISCDEIYTPELSGIFRVGSRVKQVDTTGVYKMAVEENLSFYGIGASYCDLYFGASRTGLVIFASGSGCHYEIDVVGYTAVCQQWYENVYFWYLGAWNCDHLTSAVRGICGAHVGARIGWLRDSFAGGMSCLSIDLPTTTWADWKVGAYLL